MLIILVNKQFKKDLTNQLICSLLVHLIISNLSLILDLIIASNFNLKNKKSKLNNLHKFILIIKLNYSDYSIKKYIELSKGNSSPKNNLE